MSFKFASSYIDVSPSAAIPLSGLIKRAPNGEFCGIAECKMRIAWWSIADEKELIFLLADYLFFPNQLADLCAEFLQAEWNIPREQIVFAGTHTHSGPALGFLPWEKEQPEYLMTVFDLVKKELFALSKQRKSCSLSNGMIEVEKININRRKPVAHWRKGFKKVAFMLPYAEGPVNPKVKLLSFEEEGGKKTLFVTYASHPVFNRNLKLSSDYPGLLAKRIVDKGWADEVFVFQGFNGDVRPNYQGRFAIKDSIRALFYGPDFAEYEAKHIDNFVAVILSSMEGVRFKPISSGSINIAHKALTLHSRSGKTARNLLLKKINLGEQLQILTANAEMFVTYEKDLPDHVFPIGCTDLNIGYVPRVEDLPLEGYEVSEAPLNNGMDGPMMSADILKVRLAVNDLLGSGPASV